MVLAIAIPFTPAMASASSGSYIRHANAKCLEIENSWTFNGAPAQQWSCVGQQGALWYWEGVDTGGFPGPDGFRIRNYYSNKCLVIEGASNNNGARAVLYDCFGRDWPLWIRDGRLIRNMSNGKCLEIENSAWNNGAHAQQWACMGQDGANWL